MLIRDRHEKLLSLINEKTRLSFNELTKRFKISESTLRRDLNELSAQGLVKIVRGGAESVTALLGRGEDLLDKRYNLHAIEKESIGRYAASLIQPGDFVFIDSGSTTEKMCEYITERKANYITIGLKQAMILSRNGLDAHIAPGKIKQLTEGLQGEYTLEFLSRFNFTLAFFGALGITLNGGVSTTDGNDAVIKSSVLKRTDRSYVISDPSKFGIDTAVKFCELHEVGIITHANHDQDLSEISKHTKLIEVD